MSIEQYKLAWERDIPEGEKIILLRLADFADPDGHRVYPSIGRIAHDTGFTERHVKRTMKKWRDKGVLVDLGFSEYGTRKYKLNMDKLPTRPKYDKPISKWNHSEKAQEGVKSKEGVTLEAEGVTLEAIRGELDVTLPVSSTHQSLPVSGSGQEKQAGINGTGEVVATDPPEILVETSLDADTLGANGSQQDAKPDVSNGFDYAPIDARMYYRGNDPERKKQRLTTAYENERRSQLGTTPSLSAKTKFEERHGKLEDYVEARLN